jgi:glutathione synthase/RimK-type ligase-like ATP-grasp enzyme
MKIQMISRKGSKAAKVIYDNTAITKVKKKGVKPDLIINYGVPVKVRQRMLSTYKTLDGVVTLNAVCCHNKYKSILKAERYNICVPSSKQSLSTYNDKSDWLLKKEHSYGGKGIKIPTTRKAIKGFYYQKCIKNRQFELRVHAFSWINQNNWGVQKRVGSDDTIAWNFSNGGKFITIRNDSKLHKDAVNISGEILKIFKMEFGAIDFIMDDKNNLYFIEINSQPGMSGLSDSIYINAMNKLFDLRKNELSKYLNH